MPRKIITIVGARPQFIKAGTVSNLIKKDEQIQELIIHTGQHFDKNMSKIFFDELSIPIPKYNLSISGLSHGAMTGRMLEKIESILIKEKPELVLVYGDTDSTLAGSLAASKLEIPLAHVEAGLRSKNFSMPEEKNRILTDALSQLLFCPSSIAIENLKRENITQGVCEVGDVMFDAINLYGKKIQKDSSRKDLVSRDFVLCTIHRKDNTTDLKRLDSILNALKDIANQITVILPLHPRTKAIVEQNDEICFPDKIEIIDPLSYLEFLELQKNAKCIFTDSGGLQKEAFFNKVPCITLRDETEWTETVDLGWNTIVGADTKKILKAWEDIESKERVIGTFPYGKGDAANKIVNKIKDFLN